MQRDKGFCTEKVVVKDAGGKGKGLFCIEEIKQGEIVLIWQGWVIEKNELLKSDERYIRDAIQISDNFFVGCVGDEDIEKCDYVNHSCSPNAGFCGDLTIIAMRDIPVGEEVTFDYGMCDNLSELKMECTCGSEYCRKIISGKDWMNPLLQEKYKGYFSYYITNEIRNISV